MIDRMKMVNCLVDIGELRSQAFKWTPKLSARVSTPTQIARAERELVIIVDELEQRVQLMKEGIEPAFDDTPHIAAENDAAAYHDPAAYSCGCGETLHTDFERQQGMCVSCDDSQV
jgi:hypothetical protein